jgi:hypothetical protein
MVAPFRRDGEAFFAYRPDIPTPLRWISDRAELHHSGPDPIC